MENPAPVGEAVLLPTTKTHLFDPPSELGVLRASRPLCRLRYADGALGWLVTSYELAKTVLKDQRFGMDIDPRSPVADRALAEILRNSLTEVQPQLAGLLSVDPPIHTRYRRLVASHFTKGRVQELASKVEGIVNTQLDVLEREGPPADLVGTFNVPIAVSIHCLMLGVPMSDGHVFAPISQPFLFTADLTEVGTRLAELQEYLLSLVARRRATPSDDLISDIVAHEELTNDQVVSLAFNFMTGGRGSVEDMIGLAVLALLCHPEQMEALCVGAVPIDTAIEELLRYIANFAVAIPRRALERVELQGVSIERGEILTVSLAAANRDPDKWNEPDALHLDRSALGHVAFGQGPHVCLGQHLARLTLRSAIRGLLERFSGLRLAIPTADVTVYGSDQGGTVFGVHELPVTW